MPCEHYKDALIEAAASGATPLGDLRAHFDECASCRAAFGEEQSLFSAIDSGLQAEANAEVPTSLIPRVRARLDESAIASPRWSSSWFALVGAAVAAASFFLVVTTRQKNPQLAPTNLAVVRPPAPQIIPLAQGVSPSTPPKKENSGPRLPGSTARSSVQPAEFASHKPTPEILVPHDQALLLVSYAQEWGSRKRPPLVAGDVAQTAVAPLEVAPIQIPELDVKPLTEEGSQ